MRFGFEFGLHGGRGLGSGSISAAQILYTTSLDNFVYQTDGSGNIVLDNTGTSGAINDLLLATGRGIELGATNTFTVTANYITWFDITTKSHKTTTTSKTFASETVNSILASTNEVNASDLAILDANPNLLGKLALDGTGSIDELNVALTASDQYFMCSEKSGAYLVDARSGYGSELVANGTFDTDTSWTKVSTTISGGVANFTGAANARVVQNGAITEGVIYIISYEIPSYTSGTFAFYLKGTKGADRTSIGVFTDIIKAGSGVNEITPFSENLFVGSIDNVSVREATAEEIANYASTVRTNADFQESGIQTTAFTKDALNVPTAYDVAALNLDDGGYGDTQWNPSLESAFWIEEIIDGVVYQHNYDGTNLTTYTDNVAGAPALHTPENADYIFGKGVYPKVTADGYTEHILKAPSVIVNGYSTYNQASRYAILAAI